MPQGENARMSAGLKVATSKAIVEILSMCYPLDQWMIILRSLWKQTKNLWDQNELDFIEVGTDFKRELKNSVFLTNEEVNTMMTMRNYNIFDRIYHNPSSKILIKTLLPLIGNLNENYSLVIYSLAEFYGYSYFKLFFRKENQIKQLLPALSWYKNVPELKIVPFSSKVENHDFLVKSLTKGAVIVKKIGKHLHVYSVLSPVIWDFIPTLNLSPQKMIKDRLSVYQSCRKLKWPCKPTTLTVCNFDADECYQTLNKSVLTKYFDNIYVQTFIQFDCKKFDDLIQLYLSSNKLRIRFLEKAYYEGTKDISCKITLNSEKKILMLNGKFYTVDVDFEVAHIITESLTHEDFISKKYVCLKLSSFLFSDVKSITQLCKTLSIESWIKKVKGLKYSPDQIYLITKTNNIDSIKGKEIDYNKSTPWLKINNEVWFYNDFFENRDDQEIKIALSKYPPSTFIRVKQSANFKRWVENNEIWNILKNFNNVCIELAYGWITRENDQWKFQEYLKEFQIPRKRKTQKTQVEFVGIKLPKLEDINLTA